MIADFHVLVPVTVVVQVAMRFVIILYFWGEQGPNFEEPELEIQLAAADMLLLQPDWALKV